MPPPKKQSGKPPGTKGKNGTAKPADEPSKGTDASKAGPPGKPAGGGKKARDADPAAAAAAAEARNTMRTLVSGSSSWTGKLPMNLWSEHCQKQRWQKPDYGMRKLGGAGAAAAPEGSGADPAALVAWAAVRRTNPKNGDTSDAVLRIPPPHEHLLARATAAEARHLAATYALFRVASAKNMHMMLPPNVRDVWRALQDIKAADLAAGRAWMYREDPFAGRAEHDADAEDKRKRREDADKRRAERAEEMAAPSLGGAGQPRNDAGWARAPGIELGKRRRVEAEATVRRYARWNPRGEHMVRATKDHVVDELSGAGFRRSHASEAADTCKDRDECIEWLLIHVPEDDLPPWAFPRDYRAGISVASTDVARENAITLLAKGGYPSNTCAAAFDRLGGDALAAAAELQASLDPDAEAEQVDGEGSEEAWTEEMETLEAVFDARFKRLGPASCSIDLQIEGVNHTLVSSRSRSYPQSPPILALHGPLPAYIKLKIYQAALKHVRATFLGEPMVYNILDWLENEARAVVENPGSLLEISAATGATSGEASAKERASKQHRMPRRPRGRDEIQDRAMLEEHQARKKQQDYQNMLRGRQALPAWALRDEIVSTVQRNQVTIISGETGSGKSTQVVQFVLDDMIESNKGSVTNIVCTQPRRIAALGLADRVSAERCTRVGDQVGYSIRGESKQSPGRTRISFVTTGVLLRRFQGLAESKSRLQDALVGISHVFVDEVHERDLDTDFLLILLRNVTGLRPDLRIVLMSATIEADQFEKYFKTVATVGNANIPGRTFPITDYYLQDALDLTGYQLPPPRETKGSYQGNKHPLNYELISATVAAIHKKLGDNNGGILLFLPGVAEINRTMDAVRTSGNFHVLPLHAALSSSEQRQVFLKTPAGKRKVVVATNIAETSITVEDIVVVIDCGKVKQTSYDPISHMVRLEETLISKAAAMQRRGRSGRVRAGQCYKLYSKETEHGMMNRPDPEILRTPLEQLFLMTRAMGIVDVHEFLGGALTPPSVAALDKAQALLLSIGAMDGSRLTALGEHLARIPADLRLGKLLVYGALFGCLDHCLNIAAILSAKSPFIAARDVQAAAKEVRSKFADGHGDLIGDMRAFEEWLDRRKSSSPSETRQWITASYLSWQALQDIQSSKIQFISSLKDIGFLHSSRDLEVPKAGVNVTLLRAVIAGAFYPQTARIQLPDNKYASTVSGAFKIDPEAKTIKFFLKDTGRCFVHPSSTLFSSQSFVGNSTYLSWFTSMKTDKAFIRELTPFNAFTLLLFCGGISLDTRGRGLVVDGWLKLQGWARIGVLSSRLRSLLDDILARHFDDPSAVAESQESKDVIKCVQGLLQFNGLDA